MYNKLEGDHSFLADQFDTSYKMQEKRYEQIHEYVKDLEEKSRITIYDQKIHWNVKDGSGNQYYWQIPITTFEHKVKYNTNYDSRGLTNTITDENYSVAKLEPFVLKRFSNVIGDVWDNSDNKTDFVYNIWFIVNHLTVYSEEVGKYPDMQKKP